MTGYVHDKMILKTARNLAITAAVLMLVLISPALASLGGAEDSVQDDQARMHAKIRTTAGEGYTIHELMSPLGTVVREYVSISGRVFAVSWQGPFQPDMKQILGTYFGLYSRAAKEQRQIRLRRSQLSIHEPSLVLQSAGHMRAYFGLAYDPGLLPPGVNVNELR